MLLTLVVSGGGGIASCGVPASEKQDFSESEAASVDTEPVVKKVVPNAVAAEDAALIQFPVISAPTPLPVTGYHDASHVGPSDVNSGAKPVVVVLHGNFDRPEWQCEMWKDVASWYGWVLCPRGVRTEFATLREDRWTYKGGAVAVNREIHAALEALEQKYPNMVSREGMVLVGFSLGAILLPQVIKLNEKLFPTVFVIEGGMKQLEWNLPTMKENGVNAIGIAMSLPGNRENAFRIKRKIIKMGYIYEYVDMQGGGHNYRSDFSTLGREALKKMISRNGAAQ